MVRLPLAKNLQGKDGLERLPPQSSWVRVVRMPSLDLRADVSRLDEKLFLICFIAHYQARRPPAEWRYIYRRPSV